MLRFEREGRTTESSSLRESKVVTWLVEEGQETFIKSFGRDVKGTVLPVVNEVAVFEFRDEDHTYSLVPVDVLSKVSGIFS